jgi:hypothetical protein
MSLSSAPTACAQMHFTALRRAMLSVLLGFAGCTTSPQKDVGASAVGSGAGVVACVATMVVCPALIAIGAGSALLIRKLNVSRSDHCVRAGNGRGANIRARQTYC